jgi:non-heme chloroperoxidase
MNRRMAFQTIALASAATALAEPRSAAAHPIRSPRRIHADDGTELSWSDWGGAGPTILMVHSWSMNSGIWRHQIRDFKQAGFRVVTFDRRGHGRSQMTGRGYDMHTLASDLSSVIEQLDLRNIILIGHSMGCGEAVEYVAAQKSGRVSKLVLLAPITPYLTQSAGNPAGIDAALLKAARESMSRDFPKWAGDNAAAYFRPSTSPETVAWGVRMLIETPAPVAIACAEAFAAHDFRPALSQIKIPALVIHGDMDVSAPLKLTGEPTAKRLERGRLIVVAGAPHGLYETDAEQVNREILAFVDGA